jgi:Protein of unknown function (DUF3634)
MAAFIVQIKLLFYRVAFSPLFIIIIKNGRATKVWGNVKIAFINDCTDIVTRNEITSGLIYVVKDNYGNAILKASGNISKNAVQQLRNAWGIRS